MREKIILPADFTMERYGVTLRLVTPDDAAFILDLRTDPLLSQFLSTTSASLQEQVEWLKGYKRREAAGDEYYFVAMYKGVRYGLARIYNIQDDGSFVTGSWLFARNAPDGMAILGSIATKEIAYELLHLTRELGDIRKDNHRVLRYAKSYKPTVLRETDLDVFLEFSRENFEKYKQQYIRICSRSLSDWEPRKDEN